MVEKVSVSNVRFSLCWLIGVKSMGKLSGVFSAVIVFDENLRKTK